MTVTVVMASLVPIVWSTGVGSDAMKPIAAPILGGMITSTIHVLILNAGHLLHHETARPAQGDPDSVPM
jgi:Cu/Ag efflux pump CusA